MLDFGFYHADCMEHLKDYPDGYFDLAIADPVYGDVTQGCYMKNLDSTTKLAKPTPYHLGIWNQKKTRQEFFDELFRVSKAQIIWGGVTTSLRKFIETLSAGLCGIKNEQAALQTLK